MFSNKNKSIYNVSIKIDSQEINQTKHTKFLWLIIDSNFSLNRQIQQHVLTKGLCVLVSYMKWRGYC